MTHVIRVGLRAMSPWVMLPIALGLTVGNLALMALGAGGWGRLLAHPARVATALAMVVLACVAAFSPFNMSAGRREDVTQRKLLLPFVVFAVLFAWLPAYDDRRELLTIDGDAVRWVGFALLVAGGILRVWPVFVLGRRFSGLVAIQLDHRLVTDGPYRFVRHPSYAGGLLALVGLALVFRSGLGLLLMLPLVWLILVRIAAEERLLAAEFGEDYAAYRKRTWRLVPFVY